MKKRFGNVLLSFLFLIGIPLTASWAKGAETAADFQIRAFFKQGIDRAFDMDEKAGNAAILQGIALDRDHPLGYSLLAMTHLFFYEMNFDEKERQERKKAMLRYATEAVARGEKRIEKNPNDSQAYFAMSLAKITRVRLYLAEKSYWAIAQETSNIWDYLEKAKASAPENYDIYFVMGLLHFHLDQLPGVTRFLSSLWVTSGDRRKGLEELELAAKKGDLLKDLAKSELVSVYLNFENKPERALAYARELKEKFPQNYNFIFGLASVLADLKRSDEAFLLAAEISRGIQSGIPPYRPELRSRYYLLMGRIFFDAGDYAKAEENFQKIFLDSSPYNARNRAWAYVRMGMAADLRKERKKAEDYYQKALDVEGAEGLAQATARQYQKTPYVNPP